MSDVVTVREVRTRRDLRMFVRLPRRLYGQFDGYVPPLDMQQRDVFNAKRNPFFKHGEAKLWLAFHGDRPVGRVSAQIDRLRQETTGDFAGQFGSLAAIDDRQVVQALTAVAEAWLREKGMKRVVGPFTLSINQESGLLIDGRDERAMFMSPWDPAYLQGAVETLGYRKVRDLFAYEFEIGKPLPAPVTQLIKRPEFQSRIEIRLGDMRKAVREGLLLRDIVNDAWRDNWGFVPIPDYEMEYLSREMRPFLVDDCLAMADVDGKFVGFSLVFPNLHELYGDLGGRPSPLGWLKVAHRYLRKRVSTARIILLGVRSEVKNTPFGAAIAAMLVERLTEAAAKWKISHVELGWVLEDNRAMIRVLELCGARHYKTYRVYEKDL